MLQVFDAIADENVHYKRNEFEFIIIAEYSTESYTKQ